MISNLHVRTLIGAESAYAGISYGTVNMDVRLQAGRSVASSLRQWAMQELQQANKRTHRAMMVLAAAKALDAAGPGATHAIDDEAQVESAADLLERLAGFAATYANASAMDAGGQALVDSARSMAMLLRAQHNEATATKAAMC